MKIAVATEDGEFISEHFGRSPYFAIYEIDNGEITVKEMRLNTFSGHFRGGDRRGHGEEGRHETVAEALGDCSVVISHGMGRRAWEDLRARGIEMIVTNETEVENAVRMYLGGELRDHTEKLH
jgi:predicted Fe-Mo cluster-binding NifX family protein